MTTIEADKFLIHPSQATIEPGISSVRTVSWNGLIVHEVQINFVNEDQRRHFLIQAAKFGFRPTIVLLVNPKD